MWRMAKFICHICGERKNYLGHRWSNVLLISLGKLWPEGPMRAFNSFPIKIISSSMSINDERWGRSNTETCERIEWAIDKYGKDRLKPNLYLSVSIINCKTVSILVVKISLSRQATPSNIWRHLRTEKLTAIVAQNSKHYLLPRIYNIRCEPMLSGKWKNRQLIGLTVINLPMEIIHITFHASAAKKYSNLGVGLRSLITMCCECVCVQGV